MPEKAPGLEMAAAYDDYAGLLSATGHEVALPVLAQHLAGGEERAADVEATLLRRSTGEAIERAAREAKHDVAAVPPPRMSRVVVGIEWWVVGDRVSDFTGGGVRTSAQCRI